MKTFKNILSFLYLAAYHINRFLFKYNLRKIYSYSSYVVSVGNLSVGGTGKTPMVKLVTKILLRENLLPAIVSSGYKRKSSKQVVVSNGKQIISNIKEAGDEPYMLATELPGVPVLVGKKFRSAFSAIELFNIKALLFDDSFQTNNIKKNLDILLVDVSVNINQYNLIPRGRLREPLSAVNRAHIIIFTKSNFDSGFKNKIKKLILSNLNNKKIPVFESEYTVALKKHDKNNFISINNSLKKPVVAFCGIANDSIFKTSVRQRCVGPLKIISFPDHHTYQQDDFRLIQNKLSSLGSSIILTTKKDFFKIKDFFPLCDIFILDVQHNIINEASFSTCLQKNIKEYYSSTQSIV